MTTEEHFRQVAIFAEQHGVTVQLHVLGIAVIKRDEQRTCQRILSFTQLYYTRFPVDMLKSEITFVAKEFSQ